MELIDHTGEKTGQRIMGSEFTNAVMGTRAVIRNVLAPRGRGDEVDDVLQITWESVYRSHTRYDPSLGSVEAWVTTIAKRRALDHVAAAQRHGRLQTRLEDAADGPELALSAIELDFAETVIERIDAAGEAKEVLAITARMVSNPMAYKRAMALFVVYGEDVRKAASSLGISEDAMRDSRREVTRCAQVVRKALDARRLGKTLNIATLLDCLPVEGEESGAWATAFSVEVVRAGGFDKVSVEDLIQRTGFKFHTCRQYLKEAKRLLQVALTVLTEQQNEEPGRASQ